MTAPPSNGHRQPDARLLVVEDEPNILELLAASLRYAGFEVITAAAQHAVAVHGHKDDGELRDWLKTNLKDEMAS